MAELAALKYKFNIWIVNFNWFRFIVRTSFNEYMWLFLSVVSQIYFPNSLIHVWNRWKKILKLLIAFYCGFWEIVCRDSNWVLNTYSLLIMWSLCRERELQSTTKVRKRPPLRRGRVSPRLPVPDHIPKPPYVDTSELPEISSEHQIHDSEGIARMKAACELAARVLDYAGTLVRVRLWACLIWCESYWYHFVSIWIYKVHNYLLMYLCGLCMDLNVSPPKTY